METCEEAAHRELAEEMDWSRCQDRAALWNRGDVFEWRGGMLDVRERWYLADPDVVDVDCTGWTPEE